jgi:hypothetical protein
MEENTQNEQVINLDEEQLQAVTGGVQPGGVQFVRTNSVSARGAGNFEYHMQNANNWFNLAEREHNAGNPELRDKYINMANHHIESANNLNSGSITPGTPGSPSSPRSPK